jgi:CRP/FNR family cyclic AMP-dependent transcriptional regulator
LKYNRTIEDSTVTSLVTAARGALLPLPEVSRLTTLRRTTSLFSQGQAASSVFVIEEGLVKLTRSNGAGGRIILAIMGPGHVIGEESLEENSPAYYAEAEVLTNATIIRTPLETLKRALSSSPELQTALVAAIVDQKRVFAEKIELLCLHDVEFRILHYLAELATLVKPTSEGEGHQLPITQLELADLIGATRETTSTTLNQLERRGLVKLSRRLLTITSPSNLRTAAHSRVAGQETSVTAGSVI